jgi:RHS repeat-associated protein
VSAVRVLSSPHRIKASHRRRWKGAAGRFVQRYYDPIIGRFLSVDPVSADPNSGASFNRYNYAGNNPYRFTDPDGRQSWPADGQGPVSWDPPSKTGPFGEPLGGTDPGVSSARELTSIGAKIEEAIVTFFSGAAEARVAGEVGEAGAGAKTYTTYTREKPGTVYSGRTSGKGTPQQQVAARTSRADHQAKTAQGYGPAKVDKNSPNANAIRGREQQLIEKNGGAQSQGGTSGNAINGVAPSNPNAETYQKAADQLLK